MQAKLSLRALPFDAELPRSQELKYTHESGDADHWPETVYRYFEHQRWEPQSPGVGDSKLAFREALKHQEAPLNFLLNMLMVSLPGSWIRTVLGAVATSPHAVVPADLMQRYPTEIDRCHPDVRLESATERVFIECKVKADTNSAQIMRYLLLSAHLDEIDRPKRPWVLYLMPNALEKHWQPHSERLPLEVGGLDALRTLVMETDLWDLGSSKRVKALLPRVEALRSRAILGHGTWTGVGEALRELTSIPAASELELPLHRVINDFLSDIEQRGLWTEAE